MARKKVMVILLIFLLLAAGLGVSDIVAKSQVKSKKTSIKTNTKKVYDYTYDFELNTLEGKKVKLSNFKGKIVILNFWTTWCPYCVKELPEMQALNQELVKQNKAVFFAVNLNEDSQTVSSFMNKKRFKMPVLMDLDGSIGNRFGVQGIPATFIIGKDGKILKNIVGSTTKQDILNIIKGMI
jgi:peroxiredoxin